MDTKTGEDPKDPKGETKDSKGEMKDHNLEKKTRKRKHRGRKRKEKKEPVRELSAKEKLKEKLRAKKLSRVPRLVREERLEYLEELLEECKDPVEKERLQKEIKLLEDIFEREDNFNGEFPEYADTGSYGGSQERPD